MLYLTQATVAHDKASIPYGLRVLSRRRLSATIIAAAAIAFSGCGDGSATSGPSAADQHAALIAQGDAVCAGYNATARTLRRALTRQRQVAIEQNSIKPYAASLAAARDRALNAVSQFEAIPVPAADRAAMTDVLALMRRQQKLLSQLADVTAKDDTEAFASVNGRLVAVNNSELKQARALGFQQCGRRS